MTTLLIQSWPYALVYWSVFLWAYVPEFILNSRSRSLTGSQDAGSFRFIMVVQGAAIGAGFAIAFNSHFAALAYPRFYFALGLAVMISGRLLRRHCLKMLGESFTAVVVVRPDQQIIQRGAYRWVRHPSYTAGMILFSGTMLALANWLSVALVLAAAVLVYFYRVRIEERALIQTLGEPYRDYMQQTRRFVPWLF
ncbi:MAG TPA: isoprenylcysteine carboxylmethyltransferase family protein [Candidatus Angelobacter sp.]|nr:isoprenylcysteine carboxylmethyltransferase family protein [Candidatus Angelobacter sp.]